jgi:oxygen-independent coproporphyrinogen-3 oxidase
MTQAGIYIHIPFCRSRCSYCDFATCAYDASFAERYVAAVCREIESFGLTEAVSNREVDTIYFGGGTPSLLTPRQVSRLLDAVQSRFQVHAEAEITLEVDPGTASFETLCEFRRLGINRASFGAQTFDDAELRRLNRRHTAQDARETFDDLRRAGFDNISLDLIAGLPAQTIADFERNIAEAVRLRPDHVAFYFLEIHEGTPLANSIKRNRTASPDEDVAAEMYHALCEKTRANGFTHYEISNFCQPGYEARHNTKYWTRSPVFGFGCAAHSFDGKHTRWSNERDASVYVKLTEHDRHARVETIVLDAADEQVESLFLPLRMLQRGVDLDAFNRKHRRDVRREYASDLARLDDAGLIEFDRDTMRLTSTGALLSNEVFAAFV